MRFLRRAGWLSDAGNIPPRMITGSQSGFNGKVVAAMSLRKALATLPDDLATRTTVRAVVTFLQAHPGESFDANRISRGTGASPHNVEVVLCSLANGFVIECDGDPGCSKCTFTPDRILDLEVRTFLRGTGRDDVRLHRGIDRFRGRYGSGA